MDYSILVMWAPVLLGLGMVSGFLAGLLGIGGGIVLVPGLFFSLTALGFPPDHIMHVAIGTSLAVIIPTGMSSARAHWKRQGIRMDLVKKIGSGIVFGVFAGTVIASYLSSATLNLVFAISLFILAGIMMTDPARVKMADDVPGQPWSGLMGGLIGMLSTLMGIGGATISVPYMTLCRVPIHQAIGTASMLGLIISAPAAFGFLVIGWGQDNLPPFSLGYINFLAFALITPASVLAAPWGAAAAHKVPVKPLRQIFALFIVIVAVKMLYGVLRG
jgi:uncharacterized membrane protein YfcA